MNDQQSKNQIRPIYVLIDDAIGGPIRELDQRVRGTLETAGYRVVGYQADEDMIREASTSGGYGPLSLVVIDQDFARLTDELLWELRELQIGLPFLFLGEPPVFAPVIGSHSIPKPITDLQQLSQLVTQIVTSARSV